MEKKREFDQRAMKKREILQMVTENAKDLWKNMIFVKRYENTWISSKSLEKKTLWIRHKVAEKVWILPKGCGSNINFKKGLRKNANFFQIIEEKMNSIKGSRKIANFVNKLRKKSCEFHQKFNEEIPKFYQRAAEEMEISSNDWGRNAIFIKFKF